MSNLQTSKLYEFIDMLNDISRDLDDIFTIDNPEFEKHMPYMYIYPTELQLNKANTSDKGFFSLIKIQNLLADIFILAFSGKVGP